MNSVLPTHAILNHPDLSPACFAATLAVAHDVDAGVVASVMSGTASTKSLPVRPAIAVCDYIARGDLDAAVAATRGDQRKTVYEVLARHRARLADAAVLEQARSFVWDVAEVRDDIAAKITAAVATLDVAAGQVPRVEWLKGPSTSAAGSLVSPPEEICSEVLVSLLDGSFDCLDVRSADFDAVAALVVVAQLVPNVDFVARWASGSGPCADLPAKAAALLAAPRVARYGASLTEVARMPETLRDEVVALAAALTAASGDGKDAALLNLGQFRLRTAAMLAIADPAALYDGRVAACLGTATLLDASDSDVERLVNVLTDVSEDDADAAAAELLCAATESGLHRREVTIRRLPSEVKALGPMMCFATAPPTPQAPTGGRVASPWTRQMRDAATEWNPTEFAAAAAAHPEPAERLCRDMGVLTDRQNGATPRWLAYESMRVVGLAEWLRRDNATDVELISAGADLDLDGWRALWLLAGSFKGTPDELVAVAEAAA